MPAIEGLDTMYKAGDWVIYRTSKCTAHPGPRAMQVSAAPNGELYSYDVEKFWVVVGLNSEGVVVLQTRRGKQHAVEASTPRLRHASWWERLVYRSRFPQVSAGPSSGERLAS